MHSACGSKTICDIEARGRRVVAGSRCASIRRLAARRDACSSLPVVRYPSDVVSEQLVQSFTRSRSAPIPISRVAALMIARVEYPKLDAAAVSRPARCARPRSGAPRRRRHVAPRARSRRTSIRMLFARVTALNDYLFNDERFVGNDAHYEDPRNSFLNEVLDRRTGIPITLALVYMEVARRAGVDVEGDQLPGALSGALSGATRGTPVLARSHHRRASRRRAADREHVPRAAAQHAGDEAVWDVAPARPRDEAADSRAHAAESEAHLRADVLVPAGARHHRAAARASIRRRSTSCAIAACSPIT